MFALPIVECGGTDAMFFAELFYGNAGLVLLEDLDHLGLGKSTSFHVLKFTIIILVLTVAVFRDTYSLAQIIKSITARELFRLHPVLRELLWGRSVLV